MFSLLFHEEKLSQWARKSRFTIQELRISHFVGKKLYWRFTTLTLGGEILFGNTFHDSLLLPRYPLNAFCPQGQFMGLEMGPNADTD